MSDFTMRQLTELIMKQAKTKGFGIKLKEIDVGEKIALIHSEIAEAYEAYRHKKIRGKHGLAEELADALQRILHLSGAMDIDLEKEILRKLKKNKKRKWNWKNLNEKHAK